MGEIETVQIRRIFFLINHICDGYDCVELKYCTPLSGASLHDVTISKMECARPMTH